MAYISPEEVAEIRKKIKEAFPSKDGWKMSVRNDNYSTVVVSFMEGPIESEKGHVDVNHYNLQFYSEEWRQHLQKALDICEGEKESYDRNAGDPGADYCDYTYYISLNIGRWDKPYKKNDKRAVA